MNYKIPTVVTRQINNRKYKMIELFVDDRTIHLAFTLSEYKKTRKVPFESVIGMPELTESNGTCTMSLVYSRGAFAVSLVRRKVAKHIFERARKRYTKLKER